VRLRFHSCVQMRKAQWGGYLMDSTSLSFYFTPFSHSTLLYATLGIPGSKISSPNLYALWAHRLHSTAKRPTPSPSRWRRPYPAMDERIFQQLDVLERGARFNTRPADDGYNISSAEYSAYDGRGRDYNTHDTNNTLQPYHQDDEYDQPIEANFLGESPFPRTWYRS